MSVVDSLKVKIYADGADREGMLEMYEKSYIQGFTTNPTLMRKAGIEDYQSFARVIRSGAGGCCGGTKWPSLHCICVCRANRRYRR